MHIARPGDTRLDGADLYAAVFQVTGRSTMTQNDQTLQLAVGDVELEDAARPVTYFTNNRSMKWLGLQMPRQPPTLKSRRSITKQGHRRHGY